MLPLLLPAAALAAGPLNGTCSGNYSAGVCLHDAYPILRTFSCTDPGACCANCSANPKCVSWNINTGMKSCFLRGNYRANPGAQCISARCGPRRRGRPRRPLARRPRRPRRPSPG